MTRVRLASGSVTIASVAVVLVGCGSSSSSSSSSEISNAAVAPSTATAGAKTFAAQGILIHFQNELNCQYTRRGQSAILAACAQMLDTLHQ